MSRVKYTLWAMLGLTTLFWVQVEPTIWASTNLFEWRSGLIQYSGILALMLMSLAMLLALRLPLIEQWTQGIDKGYRIHKWLGISALLLGVFHWLTYHIPKWLISLELLTKPARLNGSGPHGNLSGLALWLKEAKPFAMEMGEWGFYALIGLLGISLWSVIKYKPFRLTHRLMAVVYLLIAAHSVILLKKAYWGEPIYWLTLLFIAVGSWAALYSLLGLVGRQSRYPAHVEALHYCVKSQTLDLTIQLNQPWQGHKAGQFAYLRFAGEEPHPFTIACANQGTQLRFLIKELGDFTTGLHDRLRHGDTLEVEGPYGKFDFATHQPQIWVGGGVGIAPFMAGLDWLAREQSHPQVYLFFCCQQVDPNLCAELRHKAQATGVALTIIDSSVDPRLSAEDIARRCGDLSRFQFYFCGPVAFSKSLKKALKPYQVDLPRQFHEEQFVMR
ncbi:ferredoxin reductase family protein [Vibrio metoecus]|uniref:ferredoxin reductase family protein n=1 Tax=Vibrio metoecus TaxID=1481663 RepID=UPI000BA8E326|nr:ferric reductase-like transmembrane domain-containing protein [Vibrio metoecus]PAR32719.1 ferric reductase [Vibrio metoecus]PAR53604.1 ferric reductase [Vibrio metoecus]WKY94847.1 ferric reductase-like transmembrane domain-containing protein [Vibrio metoecus]